MDWKLSLEVGAVPSGLDYDSLIENIESEVEKVTSATVGNSFVRESSPAVAGAQGHDSIVQWLLHFSEQPQMLQVYAKAFLFSINGLMQSATKSDQQDSPSEGNGQRASLKAEIVIFGKEIALPTTTAAIATFLSEIGISER